MPRPAISAISANGVPATLSAPIVMTSTLAPASINSRAP